MNDKARQEMFAEALALLKQAQQLLLDARARHEKRAAELQAA
jgi:hypothetical protein